MLLAFMIIIVVVSSVIGTITGMGGGVIVKPIFDLLGKYDAMTVGIFSSVSVLVMSIVAAFFQIGNKPNVSIVKLIILGIASAGGGIVGNIIFDIIRNASSNVNIITIIQNILLALIMIAILIYMINKRKIKPLELKHWIFYFIFGSFLGIISSFLGIGGGPLNVALLIMVFNLDIKTATFSSIIIIIFSQIAKLSTVVVASDFVGLDLKFLPYIAIAAAVGGLVGGILNKKFNEKAVVIMFDTMLVIIFVLCIANIIIYSLR